MIGHQMIGEWTNHLWQSTLFAVAAALVTLVFRKNRAQVRYWLWLSASVKFLIPFALLINLGNSLWSAFAARKIAIVLAPPAVSLTVEQIAQPFTVSFSGASPVPLAHTAGWIAIAILGVWMCGSLGVLLVRVCGWLRIQRVLRASTPIDIAAAIVVRSSPGLLEPGVVGLFRPMLLLPEGILEHLPPSQLEAVIAHELSHVRRRDNLTAALHMVVEAVFWFHPFVWWIGARLVEERERACDEAVLSLGGKPRDYADAIVSVCKLYVESPLACIAGISGADLKKRIVRIMRCNVGLRMSRGRKLLLGTAALTVVTAPVVFGWAQRREDVPDWQSAAGGKMAFEVASIRQSKPGTYTPPNFALDDSDTYGVYPDPHGHLSADLQLMGYIEFAYKLWFTSVQRKAILDGLPKWASTDNFEIQAKAEGDPTKDQMRLMMQSLLANRFGLRVHFESRKAPVFALELEKRGKTGPQMHPYVDGAPCYVPVPPQSAGSPPSSNGETHAPCDWYMWGIRFMPGHAMFLLGRDVSMKDIANGLPSVGLLERPVVNNTGTAGKFDLALSWKPESGAATSAGTAPDSEPQGPTFLEALQDQLGLKLKPENATLQVLVIDHIEQPSPN